MSYVVRSTVDTGVMVAGSATIMQSEVWGNTLVYGRVFHSEIGAPSTTVDDSVRHSTTITVGPGAELMYSKVYGVRPCMILIPSGAVINDGDIRDTDDVHVFTLGAFGNVTLHRAEGDTYRVNVGCQSLGDISDYGEMVKLAEDMDYELPAVAGHLHSLLLKTIRSKGWKHS